MSELSPEARKTIVDKVSFDAVLRRMIESKPMPLKDVVGTSTPRRTKQRKAVQKLDWQLPCLASQNKPIKRRV